MDDNSNEVVEAVKIGSIGGARVEEAKFKGKHDPVGELGVLVQHVAIFEPFQVQC